MSIHQEIADRRYEVILMVRAWRDAVCTTQAVIKNGIRWTEDRCDGENHLMECPCEVARQDLIAAHNKLLMVDP